MPRTKVLGHARNPSTLPKDGGPLRLRVQVVRLLLQGLLRQIQSPGRLLLHVRLVEAEYGHPGRVRLNDRDGGHTAPNEGPVKVHDSAQALQAQDEQE